MTVPDGPVVVPDVVAELAAGAAVEPVWRNQSGGLTFRLEGDPARYVKWSPASAGVDVRPEADRLRWARRWVTVPQVLDAGVDAQGATWLLTRALGVKGAFARLEEAPPARRLVVCHADACAPNTLLGDDGTPVAHVDLGRLGVADPWADLAVAAWSTVWNYGPGYEAAVYAGYGVDPDPVRIAYYRLLWDLS